MKKIIILAFLMTISIFASNNYSIQISKITVGETDLDLTKVTSLDFTNNFFNIKDFSDKNKNIAITLSVVELTAGGELPSSISIKHGNDYVTEEVNIPIVIGTEKVIPIKFDKLYKSTPSINDDGKTEIKIDVDITNTASTKTITFHYDNKAPEAPINDDIKTVLGDKHIKLDWEKVSDVSSYIVYYKKGEDGTVKSKKTSENSIDIQDLENNEPYMFRIVSVDKAGNESNNTTYEVAATPSPTTDFWEHYNGEEVGGCNYSNSPSYIFIIFMILLIIIRKTFLRGKNE